MRPEALTLSETIALAYDGPHSDGRADGLVHAALIPRWYVVRTRSRHEKKVRDQIQNRRIEVFLPTGARWSQWQGRRTRVEFPLFSGYCFVRFPLAERLRILTVYGVANLLGVNGQPEPVPDRENQAIQPLLQRRFDYDPHPFLAEGIDV